jgi:hypothetical protein
MDSVVLILDKRVLFPFLYLGLSLGVVSDTTVVHSVPYGWIKLCVVDVWLVSICKNEFATLEGGKILYLLVCQMSTCFTYAWAVS